MNPPPIVSKTDLLVFATLAAAFLAANLATSERSPVVWKDEVMFTDPAANLYFGRGFTSTAWFQPGDRVFAGNAPLYSLCLYPWIKVFGFGVVAVRSLNYVLILAVVLTLWIALGRLALVRVARHRVLLALLVLCGDGVSYSYRSGRYDALGMLLASALLLALSLHSARSRGIALFGVAVLAPWAGLQLIPYVAILGVLTLLVLGLDRAAREVAAVAAGGAVGSALLLVFFGANGVLADFRASVAYLGGAKRLIGARVADALKAPITEPSTLILLGLLSALAASALSRRDARLRSPVGVGLMIGLVVPCALGFTGKYVRYYSWMAYIPMAVCLTAHLEATRAGRAARSALVAVALLACAVGLPARLTVVALEWKLRDVAPVRRLVLDQVGPTDRVYSEFEAYYPAKTAAAALYLPPYIGYRDGPGRDGAGVMTAPERDGVNVLITKPDAEAETLRYFGGRWTRVAHYSGDESARLPLLARLGFGSKPYNLTVHRRRDATAAGAAED